MFAELQIGLQARPAFLLAVSAIGCQRAHPYHSSPTAWCPNVLTTPWETIYPSSLRSDSECEECIWILQS